MPSARQLKAEQSEQLPEVERMQLSVTKWISRQKRSKTDFLGLAKINADNTAVKTKSEFRNTGFGLSLGYNF